MSRKRKSQASVMADQSALGEPMQSLPEISPIARRDDLVNIEGIDPATELALNSIGIRKFADFRGYTPETLARALREHAGLDIAATTIAIQDWIGGAQDWMGWAELLAAEGESKKTCEQATEKESNERQAVEAKTEIDPLTMKSTEAPSVEESPTMPSNEPLAQNMVETKQVNQSSHHLQKQKPQTRNGANGEIVLSIQQARFNQIKMPGRSKANAVKFLRSEIDCRLTGAEALSATTARMALCAQIHALDTVTGEYKMLASRLERLQLPRADYRFDIEFETPKIGCYQLQIVTFLLEVNPKIAFYQGPILRVVP